MKTMKQEILERVQQEVALVVQITNTIINGAEAERYIAITNHELKDKSRQFFFYFDIYYFDVEGNDITYQVNKPKDYWRIGDELIAERDLQTMQPIMETVDGVEKVKMGNAVELLRQWIGVVPYYSLLEFYIYNLDTVDHYFDLDK